MKGINEELNSLNRNNIWYFVMRNDNMWVIGSKWMFSIKDATSIKPSFKARLCDKGFYQEHGVDYNEIFFPIKRFDSIRISLDKAVRSDYKIVQFDVWTVFLYGDLEETNYMDPPESANVCKEEVCKLRKSLCGLKQVSRC